MATALCTPVLGLFSVSGLTAPLAWASRSVTGVPRGTAFSCAHRHVSRSSSNAGSGRPGSRVLHTALPAETRQLAGAAAHDHALRQEPWLGVCGGRVPGWRCTARSAPLSHSTQPAGAAAACGYTLGGPPEGYMARVAECNQGLDRVSEFVPFSLDQQVLGHIHREFWAVLAAFPAVFATHNATPGGKGGVTLAPELQGASLSERTDAVQSVLLQLRDRELVPGWRDEFYPVGPTFGCQPSLLLERAAAPLFGVKAYGVHLNGFVHYSDRPAGNTLANTFLWVARRSASKPTYPGKLDHMVAGGQPFNLSCRDNVDKECWEEAGVPRELARTAIPVGAVSYSNIHGWACKRDTLFCYDLQLPPSFTPANTDGEVAGFELLQISEVARIIRETREFKTNCNLVIIDFLIRKGFITPDEPGYVTLCQSLRGGNVR